MSFLGVNILLTSTPASEFAVRDKLTLREMQSCAGRMQRAIMTLPPGAGWILVPLFAMMCGLKLPWHRRRTTRQVRDNFLYCGQLLKAAMGRGYYSYANFRSAPPVWTDASKSKGACVSRGFDLRAWVGLCCPHLG